MSNNDVVLIPGDISWSLKYENALKDLYFISNLPGKKVIIKGNHDFWWTSISKLRKEPLENTFFIQNDILEFSNIIISGTRLWDFPFINWDEYSNSYKLDISDDEKFNDKIRKREIERLKLCLNKMEKYSDHFKIFLTHYPPIGQSRNRNIISDLLSEYYVDLCVFGHLHNINFDLDNIIDYKIDNTRYVLVSCDYLSFIPKYLVEER